METKIITPGSIKTISVLSYIHALVLGFLGFVGVSFSGISSFSQKASNEFLLTGTISIIASVLFIIGGIALWKAKKWALFLVIILTIIFLIFSLIFTFSGTKVDLGNGLVIPTLVISLVCSFSAFKSQKIKDFFTRTVIAS